MTADLMTVKEAAVLLRCSAATVYLLCSRKLLLHQRVGPHRGRLLIPLAAIEEYLAAGTVATSHPAPAAARVAKPKLKHLRLPM